MSKPDPKYTGSHWDRFARWRQGEYDPSAGRLELRAPDRTAASREELHALWEYASRTEKEEKAEQEARDRYELGLSVRLRGFQRIYRVLAVALALFVTALLLVTVSWLPQFGDVSAPEHNEVAQRYIEKGLEETGAVNIVAGMILDYRAFDTFGESCVLFVAACCVLMLLRVDKEEDPHSLAAEDMSDQHFEPRHDTMLQTAARALVPVIIAFGVYVVLNGHISPGGGFSGGAIIGTGLILYLTAFGFARAGRFLTEKLVKFLIVSALTFYCLAKSYSFYTGANHLESFITPGTPGNILSAGLIVYLNICVGIVVACTMYCFYVMFRRGDF